MLYTSYISNMKNIPDDVARIVITRKKPNIESIIYFPELSPSWGLLNDFKNKKANHEEFANRLLHEIKNNKDAINILKGIAKTAKESNIVILCYCKELYQCHRYIIAKLLENYGVEYVGEIEING